MMMTDNPTPTQVVQEAYEKLIDAHKDNSSKLTIKVSFMLLHAFI
jgi:hypothetical protein